MSLCRLVDLVDTKRGHSYLNDLWKISIGLSGFIYPLSHHQFFYSTVLAFLWQRLTKQQYPFQAKNLACTFSIFLFSACNKVF